MSTARHVLWRTAMAAFVLLCVATPLAQKAPSISASPNPVPAPNGMGRTVITWDTGAGAPGVVTVVTDGGAETEFARASAGSAEAAWIGTRSKYEFRLHTATEPRRRLATIVVTAVEPPHAAASGAVPSAAAPAGTVPAPGPASITATPNPVPAEPGVKGTEISWDTGDGSEGRVFVAADNQEPTLFATGARGKAFAGWIGRNNTYVFRLYREGSPTQSIASVVVTRPLVKAGWSTAFRVVAAVVVFLLACALWRFIRDPEPEPLS